MQHNSMQIEPLQLNHQNLLESKFRTLNLSLSEYSFANLYLFREIHKYEVLTFKEQVFIKGVTRDKVSFIMLTSPPPAYPIDILHEALLQVEMLYPIPESWLEFFKQEAGHAYFKDEDSDYLFSVHKLTSYPGRRLSKKRNLVKLLHARYDVQAVDFTDQYQDAVAVLENWRSEHALPPTEADYQPCLEAIHAFGQLQLNGRLVYLDNIPCGFTIGETISSDCYALHFCKGLRSIKGLDQFLYQDVASSLAHEASWINWINLEQDLGLPEIRQAKHSYLPDKFNLKWRLRV